MSYLYILIKTVLIPYPLSSSSKYISSQWHKISCMEKNVSKCIFNCFTNVSSIVICVHKMRAAGIEGVYSETKTGRRREVNVLFYILLKFQHLCKNNTRLGVYRPLIRAIDNGIGGMTSRFIIFYNFNMYKYFPFVSCTRYDYEYPTKPGL